MKLRHRGESYILLLTLPRRNKPLHMRLFPQLGTQRSALEAVSLHRFPGKTVYFPSLFWPIAAFLLELTQVSKIIRTAIWVISRHVLWKVQLHVPPHPSSRQGKLSCVKACGLSLPHHTCPDPRKGNSLNPNQSP